MIEDVVPLAPTNLISYQPLQTSCVLEWDAPDEHHGGTCTGFIVTYKNMDTMEINTKKVQFRTLNMIIDGLMPNQRY